MLQFDIPVPQPTASDPQHPNKAKLRETILTMRANSMSYRRIGAALGIHWTRVGQIAKSVG